MQAEANAREHKQERDALVSHNELKCGNAEKAGCNGNSTQRELTLALLYVFRVSAGESEATAQQYLALADGNVEMAISLMFESGRAPEAENANAEPPVRAPILPTQEILVPSEPVCSFPNLSNNVFDRFRDFAVETRTYHRVHQVHQLWSSLH